MDKNSGAGRPFVRVDRDPGTGRLTHCTRNLAKVRGWGSCRASR
jgi:hypothetical protein